MFPVYYNDIPIGTMCCRIETKDGEAKLYLMTLAVLAVSLTHIAISPTPIPISFVPRPPSAAVPFPGYRFAEPPASH